MGYTSSRAGGGGSFGGGSRGGSFGGGGRMGSGGSFGGSGMGGSFGGGRYGSSRGGGSRYVSSRANPGFGPMGWGGAGGGFRRGGCGCGALIALPIIALVMLILIPVLIVSEMSMSAQTTGRVNAVSYPYYDDHNSRVCDFIYEFTVDGRLFEDEAYGSSSYCNKREGDAITVRYNPSNPSTHAIGSRGVLLGVLSALLIIPLVLLGVAGFFGIRWWRRRKQEQFPVATAPQYQWPT